MNDKYRCTTRRLFVNNIIFYLEHIIKDFPTETNKDNDKNEMFLSDLDWIINRAKNNITH